MNKIFNIIFCIAGLFLIGIGLFLIYTGFSMSLLWMFILWIYAIGPIAGGTLAIARAIE